MNKKQATALTLTALLSLSSVTPAFATSYTGTSMPTFSGSTNPIQNMVSEANEKKLTEKLESRNVALMELVNGKEYTTMTINEQMGFLKELFSVRAEIYKEKQKTVLSATDILQLEDMKQSIVTESDREDKDTALISQLVTNIQKTDWKKVKPEDVLAHETKLQETISAYQELRSAGRSLERLVDTQMKTFNISQLQVLNKFSQSLDMNGEKEKALEMNRKMLVLSDGDIEVLKKVASMLKAQNKHFLVVENEVVELSVPTISKNGGVYVDISDLAKVKNFTVKNDEKSLVIRNGENVFVVNKESQQTEFNKQVIGKNVTFVEEGKLYVPIRSLFNLFHYEVKWNETVEQVVISKQVYVKNELELLTPQDLTKGLFPEVKLPEKTKEKPPVNKPNM